MSGERRVKEVKKFCFSLSSAVNLYQNQLAMKQPDLGKKIAFIRKVKGLTQEELVEKCNINVRTIQRIESGDVIPRPITLRLILEALDYDFEMLSEELNSNETPLSIFSINRLLKFFIIGIEPSKDIRLYAKQLQFAWIAGLTFFLIGFPESGMDYARYYHRFDPDLNLIYSLVKVTSFVAMVIMMRGFIIIGDYHRNYLMKISSYFLIIHGFFTMVYDILSVYFLNIHSDHTDGGIGITYGAILILFGASLKKISMQLGRVSNIAGIIALVAGVLFITLILWWIGLILLIPLEIFEIVILYKGYELFMKKSSFSES